MSSPSGTSIRTPDQRLRVFVSSTLKELEPERRAARAAIERLRLAPVMFELGARPHPPRELYRAYLGQSDVFVGIYWQQYGWIAPDEDASGLEDEYRLAPGDMPKLIYVKRAVERDGRLSDLLGRIRDDDTASYTPFSTADELAELIEADLATLLAERFDASRAASGSRAEGSAESDPAAGADDGTGRLPLPSDAVLGRDGDLVTLLAWLGGDDPRRLITLVGAGGIGKTRLAIEAARLGSDRFDRVTFVALEHVRDSADVLPAVARALGVRDGDAATAERLAIARRGRRDLLVLDNFEQVIAAATDVASLLAALPDATVLVTSRARLRVHGEQVFDVEPLALPIDPGVVTPAEVAEAPAVRLFVDRARAADSRFQLTSGNAEDVARICRALDGVPLAIELAAACIRLLTPAALLAKLDRVLPTLGSSDRDLPEHQRTIRTTVEWSLDLLGPFARALFVRLGVFAGDFGLEAVEAIAVDELWAVDLPGTLLELVDGSLLRKHAVGDDPFFSMLVPVRELAAARFALDVEAAAAARRAHAMYYVRLAAEIEPRLHGTTQQAAVERLEAERDNVRAGFRHLVDVGEVDTVADAVWRLRLYWWIRNLLPAAKAWTDDLLASGAPLGDRTRAIAITFSSWVSLAIPGTEVDRAPLEEAATLFRAAGDRFGEGAALTVLGIACTTSSTPDLDRAEASQRRAIDLVPPGEDPTFNALFRGQLGSIELRRGRATAALAIYDEVLTDAVRDGDRFVEMTELTNAGWAWLALGEPRADLFARQLELALRLGNEDGVENALEGIACCALLRGDPEQAGVLFGAVDLLWTRTGRVDQRTYPTSGPVVERVLRSDRAREFEAGRPHGRELSRRAALRLAREYASRTALPVTAGRSGARRTDAPEIDSPGHPST